MHESTVTENNAAEAEVIPMNNKELRDLLRAADRIEEHDDFYREPVIEEQLEDDCIDEEEVAFMMGYLAA